MNIQENLRKWHDYVSSTDLAVLDELLADDCVFHSPVVHTPQRGKEISKLYLSAAYGVFEDGEFRYVREVASGDTAVLEFETELEGIFINGVDMIRWNDEGRITDFKVMIRPLKAINLLHQNMRKMLEQLNAG